MSDTKKDILTIRLPASTKDEIDVIAERNSRPPGKIAHALLVAGLKDYQATKEEDTEYMGFVVPEDLMRRLCGIARMEGMDTNALARRLVLMGLGKYRAKK